LARIRIAPGSLFSIYYSGSIGGITYFRLQSSRLFDSASFHTRRVKSIFSDYQVPGFDRLARKNIYLLVYRCLMQVNQPILCLKLYCNCLINKGFAE
jgi:hypothetical protein